MLANLAVMANMDVTTAHYQRVILTWADTQMDRHTNAQTDVVALPPPPLSAQSARLQNFCMFYG